MKNLQTYSIDHRELTLFNPLVQALSLDKNRNYLFDLSYKHLVEVKGEKALEFLQGQLTCDLNQLNEHTIRQAAMCNLKGRVLALMDVFYCHNKLYLNVPEDMMDSTIASLAKTAQFSKVTLEPTQDFAMYGFYYQNDNDLIPFASSTLPDEALQMLQLDEGCIYHLGQGRYILLVNPGHKDDLLQTFIEQDRYRGSLVWHNISLSQGHFEIYPETRGLFLPHRLGLQHSTYISFDKGCYKGQEIIARTHYKAKLKHVLKNFQISTEEKLFPGQKVFNVDKNTEVAELIDYSPLAENKYLVAFSILKDGPEHVSFENHQHEIFLEN